MDPVFGAVTIFGIYSLSITVISIFANPKTGKAALNGLADGIKCIAGTFRHHHRG